MLSESSGRRRERFRGIRHCPASPDRGGPCVGNVTRRLPAEAIRDRPIAPHSPWLNGHAEPLIGSTRYEFLDHVVVPGKRYLTRLLMNYATHYNTARTHLGLAKMLRFTERPRPSAVSRQSLGSAASITNKSGGIIGRDTG